MCTASHNPRAYTGAKLVREGGRALSGEAGIGEVAALVAEGLPDDAPGGGSVERVDIAPAYHARLRTFVDRAALRPLRIVLDGGSGMAAHTIGPVLERAAGPGPRPHLLGARRRVPRPRAEPAAGGEPPRDLRGRAVRGRRPRHRLRR